MSSDETAVAEVDRRASDRAGWRTLEFVAAIPGLAALALGSLYLSGAVQWGASLREADIIVRDALPIIPLEQMLGRGIDIAVRALGLLMAMTTGVGVSLGLFMFLIQRVSPPRRNVGGDPPSLRAITFVYAISVIVVAFFVPPLVVVSAILMAALGLVFMHFLHNGTLPRRRLWPTILYSVLVFGLVFAGFAGNAIVNPTPRPIVKVQSESGPDVRGVLVVDTGAAWYISVKRHNITAIPADRIARVVIQSREKDEEQSAISWLVNLF